MATLPRVPTGNNKQYTLDAQAAQEANTLTLNESVAGVVRAPGYCVVDRVDGNNTRTPTKREYKMFTGVSGAQLTGVTNSDGTDQIHAVGAIVEFVPDVDYEQDWYDWATLEHTPNGVHASLPSLTLVNTNALSVGSLVSANTVFANQVNASNLSVGIVRVGTLLNVSGASVVGLSTSGAFRPMFQVPGGLASQTNIGGLVPVDGSYTISFANAFIQTPASVASVSVLIKSNLNTVIGVIAIPAGATFASSASFSTTALTAPGNLTIDINSTASLAADLSVLVRAV